MLFQSILEEGTDESEVQRRLTKPLSRMRLLQFGSGKRWPYIPSSDGQMHSAMHIPAGIEEISLGNVATAPSSLPIRI